MVRHLAGTPDRGGVEPRGQGQAVVGGVWRDPRGDAGAAPADETRPGVKGELGQVR